MLGSERGTRDILEIVLPVGMNSTSDRLHNVGRNRRAHGRSHPAPFRATVSLLAILATLAGCSDTTEPETNFFVQPNRRELLVGESVQLSARGAPGPVTWSSDRTDVATVIAETGFVTAVGEGEALISAVSEGKVASAEIIVAALPELALSETTVELAKVAGETEPVQAEVQVLNVGGGTLSQLAAVVTYGGGASGWLEATLSATTAPATLQLSAHGPSLGPGVYTATVSVSSPAAPNSPLEVSVVYRVLAPATIVLSRTQVAFTAIPGGAGSQQQVEITNGGDVELTGLAADIEYAGGQAQGWLGVALNSPTAPATLSLAMSPTGLPEGNYAATVRVTSPVAVNSPAEIDVTLTVSPGPAIALSEQEVVIDITPGSNPDPVEIEVTNSGGGGANALTGLAVAVQYAQAQGGWLNATLGSQTSPTTLTLTFSATGLATGTYEANVTVTSPVSSNQAVLPVKLTVAPPLALDARIADGGVFNSFSNSNVQLQKFLFVDEAHDRTVTGLTASITYVVGSSGWLTVAPISNPPQTPNAQFIVRVVPGNRPRGHHAANVVISSTTPGVKPDTVQVHMNLQSFADDILPIFSTNYSPSVPNGPCTSCHSAQAPAPSLAGPPDVVRNALVPAFVTPGSPNTGRLICRITHGASGSGCSPSDALPMRLPNEQINLIRAWISAGAPP